MKRYRDLFVGLGFLWCGLLVAIFVSVDSTAHLATMARHTAHWWLQSRPGHAPSADTMELPPGIRSVVQLDAHRELRGVRGDPVQLAEWMPAWDQALRADAVIEFDRGHGQWQMAVVAFGEPPIIPQGYVGALFDVSVLRLGTARLAWILGAAGLLLSGVYLWSWRRWRSPSCTPATTSCPGDPLSIAPGIASSEWPSEYAGILCVADTLSTPVIICDAQWRCIGANAAARREVIQEPRHLLDWSQQLTWGPVLVQTLRTVAVPGPRSTHVATEAVSLSVARLDSGPGVAGYWISWEGSGHHAAPRHAATAPRTALRAGVTALFLSALLMGASAAQASTAIVPPAPEQQLLRWLEHEARIDQQHGRITTAIARYRQAAWLCPTCPALPLYVQHLEAMPRVAPAPPAHR